MLAPVQEMLPYIKREIVALKQARGGWPTRLLCLDLETCGFSPDKNFILQIGHTLVVDGKVESNDGVMLDWQQSVSWPRFPDAVGVEQIRMRVDLQAKEARAKGRPHHITTTRMAEEGADPQAVLSTYCEWITSLRKENVPLLVHSGSSFEERFLKQHFVRFLGGCEDGIFNDVIDTARIVKGVQRGVSKSARWALHDAVVPWLNLAAIHDIKANMAHDAVYDSWVTWLVLDELKRLAG